MEKCCSLETSFPKEELCDEKNIPTMCYLYREDRPFFNHVEGITQIANAVLKNKEKNGTDQIDGLIKQYYEGAPLFYSNEPRKAKVFKPVLLYHSYSGNESYLRDNLQSFCLSDNTQHRHLKMSLSDKDRNGEPETVLEADEKIQADNLRKIDSWSQWTNSNVNIAKMAELVTRNVHSEEIIVKSQFTQKIFSSANDTFRHDSHRSAFSKPRSSQYRDLYVNSLSNLRCATYNCCSFSKYPHKCECGRAFARSEELTRHRRIHSGHRPFRCSQCSKTFGRKDHLKKHRTTHLHISEKKVHVCNMKECQQRYTRSDALARHQWAVHGIKASVPK
ncbi:unnamed protein product [Candidula unifasciata]|uniref:C2H2-type domain-containing protein n=1 Tax=Candidula unifasciata TaxID=100452 RepID=A0A8S3ZG37_9EUPU|nr:unnamed protein product [Candidula unifasciata]